MAAGKKGAWLLLGLLGFSCPCRLLAPSLFFFLFGIFASCPPQPIPTSGAALKRVR